MLNHQVRRSKYGIKTIWKYLCFESPSLKEEHPHELSRQSLTLGIIMIQESAFIKINQERGGRRD